MSYHGKGKDMDVKEEISTIKQINSEATPIVSLSVTNLDIEVEEGKVYKDSFFIESENKVPIEGYVCTTSDKVETEPGRRFLFILKGNWLPRGILLREILS